MTPQSVTQVDLNEIPALGIVCKKCASTIAITLPTQDISNSAKCLGCGTPLWNHTEPTYAVLTGIMRTLSAWLQEGEGMPFTLGFSLREPSARASGSKV